VYGLTTIIFDKSVLLDGLKPLGLTDDQLKILTADKSHQISAGNIVLWSTALRSELDGIVKINSDYIAKNLLPTITPTVTIQKSK
jgi:hypothetical protein